MNNLLKSLSIAALVAVGATAASAQDLNFRIGVGDDRPTRAERVERLERRNFDRDDDVVVRNRIDRDDDVVVRRRIERDDDVVVRNRFVEPVAERRIIERRIIERRIVRPVARTVCRTEVRRTFRPNGVVVTRPVQICRQSAPSRRVIIQR
jgi:hypothetical protein